MTYTVRQRIRTATPVRARQRPALLPFDPSRPPNPVDARIDKLQIAYKGHRFYHRSNAALQTMLRWMREVEVPVSTPTGHGQTLFKSARGHWQDRTSVAPGWLFTGDFDLGTSVRPVGVPTRKALLTLFLNPTRFLAHQEGPLGDAITPQHLVWSADRADAVAGYSLNGDDNVLPVEAIPLSRPFLPQVEQYIQGVRDCIADHLCSMVGQPASWDPWFGNPETGTGNLASWDQWFEFDWSNWVIQKLEVYWEYSTPDALTLMHRLHRQLESLSPEARLSVYDVPPPMPPRRPDRPRWRTRQNSLSTRIKLGRADLELAVYAKEFDRVRFEVRYNANLRQILGRQGRLHPGDETTASVCRLIDQAIQDAAGRLARIFAELNSVAAEEPASLGTVADLLSHITIAAQGDETGIRRLLALLVNNACVTGDGLGDLQPALTRLVDAGVLRKNSATKKQATPQYRLASRYRQSAEALRKLAE